MRSSSVRKRTLLFVCLFAILLLPCSSLIVAETPNASVSVSIVYHNLAFEDRVFLLYAVKVTNADESVKPFMDFAKEGKATVEVSPYKYDTVCKSDPQKYYLFAFTDLDAREMTDTVTARAGVKVGDQTYYSEPDAYSICEYAAYQLGVMPNCSGTESETLKDLLVAMLDYGTQAQIYFNYRTDRLANRHYLSFADVGRTPTEGIDYQDNGDGTATVTGYDGDATDIVIASRTDDGSIVTAIKEGAFNGRSSIEAVYIPSTVIEIGEKAFDGCSSLTEIHLPATLERLGSQAFGDTEGKTIYFSGTREQWEALNEKNKNWNYGSIPTVILADGKTYE